MTGIEGRLLHLLPTEWASYHPTLNTTLFPEHASCRKTSGVFRPGTEMLLLRLGRAQPGGNQERVGKKPS